MNTTGKQARKSGGNRYAIKKSTKRSGMTSKYAEKQARWVDQEKRRAK